MNELKMVIKETETTIQKYIYCEKCGVRHVDPATHPFTCKGKKPPFDASN